MAARALGREDCQDLGRGLLICFCYIAFRRHLIARNSFQTFDVLANCTNKTVKRMKQDPPSSGGEEAGVVLCSAHCGAIGLSEGLRLTQKARQEQSPRKRPQALKASGSHQPNLSCSRVVKAVDRYIESSGYLGTQHTVLKTG